MGLRTGLERLAAFLERTANFLRLAGSRQRAVFAFIAGAVSALAFAPFFFLPVLCVTLPVLLWLMDGLERPAPGAWRALWPAAFLGWCFGFGYFLTGLYWIFRAFLVEAGLYVWVAPFAVLILSGGLAFFPAFAVATARTIWPHGMSRIVVFAAIWAISEWMRGHVLTGFPWNVTGQAFVASEALMQWAALTGTYGLSFILLVFLSALAAYDSRPGQEGQMTDKRFWQWPLASLAGLALMWGGGMARLTVIPVTSTGDVLLRIVQPNIPQVDKWKPENRTGILGQYLRLSSSGNDSGPAYTHLIWPEAALPFLVNEEPFVRSAIGRVLEKNRILVMGAIRRELLPGDRRGDSGYFFNSIHFIGADGEILDTYDKAHLVPFGEYLPARRLLNAMGLRQLTQIRGSGYRAGSGPRTLELPGAPPVSPLICYEIIFPGAVIDAGSRPGWILNLTNDAWFGHSSGPYQHLAQARLRAVEQGLPVVRAANTGVSGVIDPLGRLAGMIPLNTQGVLDQPLPQALAGTPYAFTGDGVFWVLVLGSLFGVRRRIQARNRNIC